MNLLLRLYPVVASLILAMNHHLEVAGCWSYLRPPTMPEYISIAITEKLDEGLQYRTTDQLWTTNPAENSTTPFLRDFANITSLTLWDFVDVDRPIYDRLETIVTTIHNHLCRNDDGSDEAINYCCSHLTHAVNLYDSLSLSEQIHRSDDDQHDWDALVDRILDLSPVPTNNVSLAATFFVANKLIIIENLIYPYRDLSGAMAFVREATIDAIVGRSHPEDFTSAIQLISDAYFRRVSTAPAMNYFQETYEAYLRNAVVDALDNSEGDVEMSMEEAMNRYSDHATRRFRERRRVMKRRKRPTTIRRRYRPPTSIAQDVARARRMHRQHLDSWTQAERFFEEFWATRASRAAHRARSTNIAQANKQATEAASSSYQQISSGKFRNFSFLFYTHGKRKKLVLQFFSFPGRAGNAANPPVGTKRGAGWGPSIGLKGGASGAGSGGRPPKRPKTEVNNNANQGNTFPELIVAPRPSSVSVSVPTNTPAHLTASMAYVKNLIQHRPPLVQALRLNNLDFIYPFEGRLYRLTYSSNVKQLSPLPSKVTKATQTEPVPKVPIIQLSPQFERQLQQHVSATSKGNNPASPEVVDLSTPPRQASEASSPTITLS